MTKTFTTEEKRTGVNRYLSGESVNFIADELDIAKSTLYNWIKNLNRLQLKRSLLLKILIILNEEQIVNLKRL